MSLIGECKRCGGSGVVLIEKEGTFGVYATPKPIVFTEPCPECRGGHETKVQKVRQAAQIPPSFYDSTLEDFKWNEYTTDKGEPIDLSKQKAFVDSFINDYEKWRERGLGLYFWSNIRGTGKTFLASCICNELMKKYSITTKFVSCAELIRMDQADSKQNFYKPQIEILMDCELLVLDDLGQKKMGEEWLDDILFRIIDSRYQNKKVTLCTSNIELKKIRLDDRVSDRLNKMCQPIPLPEFSFRQKESIQKKKEFFKEIGLL